jgi:NADPH-dependent curcumin reductase CurA
MTDHLGEASKLRAKLAPYVANGKIKFRTHVLEGLESAPEGLNLFFSGGNRGKLMVRL